MDKRGKAEVGSTDAEAYKTDFMCCLCIDILTGMKILGVIAIMNAIFLIVACFTGVPALMGSWYAICPIAGTIQAITFYLWFKQDSESSRQNIVYGMGIAWILMLVFTVSLFIEGLRNVIFVVECMLSLGL